MKKKLFIILTSILILSTYGIYKYKIYNPNIKQVSSVINKTYNNYVSFPHLSVIKDDPNIPKIMGSSLYTILNDKGALLINSTSYIDEYYTSDPMEKYIQLNNNYLKSFPIYDSTGKQIDIAESESNYIILVPEIFKNKIDSIKKYYSLRKEPYINLNSNNGNQKEIESYINQNIKIIFIKNNQELFSFHADVASNNKNMIPNPIIEVLTKNNTTYNERFDLMFSSLKIKLDNNSAKLTSNNFKNYLKELSLDDNLSILKPLKNVAYHKNIRKQEMTLLALSVKI